MFSPHIPVSFGVLMVSWRDCGAMSPMGLSEFGRSSFLWICLNSIGFVVFRVSTCPYWHFILWGWRFASQIVVVVVSWSASMTFWPLLLQASGFKKVCSVDGIKLSSWRVSHGFDRIFIYLYGCACNDVWYLIYDLGPLLEKKNMEHGLEKPFE